MKALEWNSTGRSKKFPYSYATWKKLFRHLQARKQTFAKVGAHLNPLKLDPAAGQPNRFYRFAFVKESIFIEGQRRLQWSSAVKEQYKCAYSEKRPRIIKQHFKIHGNTFMHQSLKIWHIPECFPVNYSYNSGAQIETFWMIDRYIQIPSLCNIFWNAILNLHHSMLEAVRECLGVKCLASLARKPESTKFRDVWTLQARG